MRFPVPRGRISHHLSEDFSTLVQALTGPLHDHEDIEVFQADFAKYLGCEFCIAFPFARTAIWAALKSANIEPGSKVLMPPLTVKPILDVVLALGLVPQFVDLSLETASFDEVRLQEALETRPKAVILTYLFGAVPNLNSMTQMLRKANVFIIEDFSQALGGTFEGQPLGTFGDVGVYSASSVKTLDTYGGGLAVTNDPLVSERLRSHQSQLNAPSRPDLIRKVLTSIVRNLATHPAVFSWSTYPFVKSSRKSSSRKSDRFVGIRSAEPLEKLPDSWFKSFTAVQAQFGIKHLRLLDARLAERKRKAVIVLNLSGITHRPKACTGGDHAYWQNIVYVNDFNVAREHFYRHGIDTARTSLPLLTNIYPMLKPQQTPNAKFISENGLYLPCSELISESSLRRVGHAAGLLRLMQDSDHESQLHD